MVVLFMPKQAVKFDGALLQELQGDVSDTIARDLFKDDLPPLASSSVIHNNGLNLWTPITLPFRIAPSTYLSPCLCSPA
ncbi:hypothetical protein F4820DRAFT_381357 [Hypoxylon rubiginosum]|uniref:Uncharacterized protein n=1 Tax=Hypoxylon rubiginosum TaxID=110542 RepID=A0ACB9YVI0_9PEZI|nr:hypothetical protein F4820DRAFT_381357 [Hypoxylon rubiginosum]